MGADIIAIILVILMLIIAGISYLLKDEYLDIPDIEDDDFNDEDYY
jgi:hypothetical protein